MRKRRELNRDKINAQKKNTSHLKNERIENYEMMIGGRLRTLPYVILSKDEYSEKGFFTKQELKRISQFVIQQIYRSKSPIKFEEFELIRSYFKLSQKDMASKLNISPSTISKWRKAEIEELSLSDSSLLRNELVKLLLGDKQQEYLSKESKDNFLLKCTQIIQRQNLNWIDLYNEIQNSYMEASFDEQYIPQFNPSENIPVWKQMKSIDIHVWEKVDVKTNIEVESIEEDIKEDFLKKLKVG